MNADPRPRLVVIAGPTAAGKTSLGIRLAQRFGGEIVSADSIQVYRYLDVGSAKPTAEERAAARHHMIDIRDPDEEFTAGDYVREARRCITDIVSGGWIPFIVGGTGLYIRLLLGGIADIPTADEEVRARLKKELERSGPEALFQRLETADPESAAAIGKENVQRMIRALEVLELTGRPLSSFQREHGFEDRPYRSIFFCVCPEREELYRRIDMRVDSMADGGLMKEVMYLKSRGYGEELKPLQSLGYRHFREVLEGEIDRDEAIRLMKRDTRRYAKRQLTWFRSEPEILWRDPRDEVRIAQEITDFLGT